MPNQTVMGEIDSLQYRIKEKIMEDKCRPPCERAELLGFVLDLSKIVAKLQEAG